MALMHTPICDFGSLAHGFILPATDGKSYSFDDIKGERGTLIMFICNHCPYVKAVIDRIASDAKELQRLGIGVVAISANDAIAHPEDSFENMIIEARLNDFSFPYLYDETQTIAKTYEANCTPDFFGYNAENQLQYRGRLDASGRHAAAPDVKRDLLEAMQMIAETAHGPVDQIPSMGCSIKWKTA
ncbi:MAG: thioredoxin family protein [Hyphomicrobiales bacterium]|nr:thioredoxin family protein [Hyphomicrobiales bacterium]